MNHMIFTGFDTTPYILDLAMATAGSRRDAFHAGRNALNRLSTKQAAMAMKKFVHVKSMERVGVEDANSRADVSVSDRVKK